jgi:hypothetical protein
MTIVKFKAHYGGFGLTELLVVMLLVTLIFWGTLHNFVYSVEQAKNLYWRAVAWSWLINLHEITDNYPHDLISDCERSLPKGRCQRLVEPEVCWQNSCFKFES